MQAQHGAPRSSDVNDDSVADAVRRRAQLHDAHDGRAAHRAAARPRAHAPGEDGQRAVSADAAVAALQEHGVLRQRCVRARGRGHVVARRGVAWRGVASRGVAWRRVACQRDSRAGRASTRALLAPSEPERTRAAEPRARAHRRVRVAHVAGAGVPRVGGRGCRRGMRGERGRAARCRHHAQARGCDAAPGAPPPLLPVVGTDACTRAGVTLPPAVSPLAGAASVASGDGTTRTTAVVLPTREVSASACEAASAGRRS